MPAESTPLAQGPGYHVRSSACPLPLGGPVMSAVDIAEALESMGTYYEAALATLSGALADSIEKGGGDG